MCILLETVYSPSSGRRVHHNDHRSHSRTIALKAIVKWKSKGSITFVSMALRKFLRPQRMRKIDCFSFQQGLVFSSESRSTADFGYKTVDASQKEEMVKDVFTKVAHKYDVMNDLMSAGAHRLWKDELVSMMGLGAAARCQGEKIPRHLDVAGGTGDVAFRVVEAMYKSYGNDTMRSSGLSGVPDADRQVVVCDINPDMLGVGRQRAPQMLPNKSDIVGFIEGNAEVLPFEDASFDIYTIAFGLRNVTNKDAALREAYRVLRKGGRIMILEFSHVENPILRQLYDTYSFNVIPRIGGLVANDSESYQYLVESIRRFPVQDDLLLMVKEAGFGCASYTNMSFGVVAIHTGFKL